MSHKDLLRQRIKKQTDEFLARGGRITRVRDGASANTGNQPQQRKLVFEGQRAPRTYVPEVVAAIEARRRKKNESRPATRASRKPRKKLVYDDFGEPLRWEWVDD